MSTFCLHALTRELADVVCERVGAPLGVGNDLFIGRVPATHHERIASLEAPRSFAPFSRGPPTLGARVAAAVGLLVFIAAANSAMWRRVCVSGLFQPGVGPGALQAISVSPSCRTVPLETTDR